MHVSDPPLIVRDVQHEPHLHQTLLAAAWERYTSLGCDTHDFLHHFLSVNTHLQVPEAGYLSECADRSEPWVRMRDAASGIQAAEMPVAAKREYTACVGNAALDKGHDEGGEAHVEDGVVVLGNGIDGYEVLNGEVHSEMVAELRVEEKAVEDVEVRIIGASVGVGRRWKDNTVATLALSRRLCTVNG
jgi:hypothetical protein